MCKSIGSPGMVMVKTASVTISVSCSARAESSLVLSAVLATWRSRALSVTMSLDGRYDGWKEKVRENSLGILVFVSYQIWCCNCVWRCEY